MRVLTFPELKSLGIPYSLVHLGRLEKAAEFPRRFHLGKGRVVWSADEIDQWLKQRAAARELAS